MTIRMRSFHFERPVGPEMPSLSLVTAQGVEFGNGRVVVQWLDEQNPALMMFENLHAMSQSLPAAEIYWDEQTNYQVL